MSVNSKMTAIADAIRNLLDISGPMGLDAMANNISSITKRGAVAGTISTKAEQYIIPAGYHNGNGTVGISSDEQAKIIAENIKNGVTILGVSGTASGDIFAIIAVTYPAGSTCTCSDGTTTLTARDTSGKALFNVTVGEWTVNAEDTAAGKSKSVNVTITATGQVENITISYAVYFLRNGELNSSLGSIVLKSGTTTFSDGVISGKNLNNSTSSFTFNNPITVSFDTLKFRALLTSQYEIGAGIGVGLREINSLPDGYYGDNYVFKAVKRVNTLTNDYEEFSLDVSALRGQSLYIVGNAIATWKIDMIWAE